MSDIVERLRGLASPPYDSAVFGGPMSRAADEIERLRKELADVKLALKLNMSTANHHSQIDFQRGARTMQEAAAKVAESYVVGKPAHQRGDHDKPKIQSMTRISIAAAIRAIDVAGLKASE